MIIQICLVIIAAVLIALVVIFAKLASRAQQTMRAVQNDVDLLVRDFSRFLTSAEGFIHADLHPIAEEAHQLINHLNNPQPEKTVGIGILKGVSKLLHFFGPKASLDGESKAQLETIPQGIKWIGSSFLIFKTIKEFMKKYEKRT